VRIREASASELLLRCRNELDDVKTGGLTDLQDKSRRYLFTAWAASGIKVARTRFRLLCGTWEPVVPMIREKFKWRTHKNESTKAEHGGGAASSREESSVMELDRRGCVVWLYFQVNQEWEEPRE